MTTSLPRSTPSAQQVDAAGVAAFVDALESTPGVEPHSLMLVRNGAVVAEGWWAPYAAERVHLLYSLSKSFTSTAAGLARAEGLLDLDDPLISHFPEFDADITDPRSRAIKLRHVAAMASGHTQEMLLAARQTDPDELVRGFLLNPPEREPGSVFAYNQPCTYSLGAVVQRRSGSTLTEYLRSRLFEPLGIGEVGWYHDHRGRDYGFSGLHARTEDIAKLGLLYLQGGVWEGRRLLPADWVREATRAQVQNPNEGNPDWRQGYGFQFWMARHGYRGDGAYGQFCVVLPEQNTVLAITSQSENMQAVLDAAWELLLPALDVPAERQDPAADEKLADRLAALRLAPVEAAESPSAGAERWTEAAFTVAAGPDAEVNPGASVPLAESVPVAAVGLAAGESGWQLTLSTEDDAVTVPVGLGEWAVAAGTPPVAGSGGWVDEDTFRADVIMLETPHRFQVTCSLRDRTATAAWRTVPLHKSALSEMCAPRRPTGLLRP